MGAWQLGSVEEAFVLTLSLTLCHLRCGCANEPYVFFECIGNLFNLYTLRVDTLYVLSTHKHAHRNIQAGPRLYFSDSFIHFPCETVPFAHVTRYTPVQHNATHCCNMLQCATARNAAAFECYIKPSSLTINPELKPRPLAFIAQI